MVWLWCLALIEATKRCHISGENIWLALGSLEPVMALSFVDYSMLCILLFFFSSGFKEALNSGSQKLTQTLLQIGVELLQGVQGIMTKASRSTSKVCFRDLILSGY